MIWSRRLAILLNLLSGSNQIGPKPLWEWVRHFSLRPKKNLTSYYDVTHSSMSRFVVLECHILILG